MRRVFWPTSGLKRDEGVVVGWKAEGVAVVVGIVEDWMATQVTEQLALDIIGSARLVDSLETSLMSDLHFTLRRARPSHINPASTLILFDPPDPVRLRYLTCRSGTTASANSHLEKQDGYGVGGTGPICNGMSQIIPLLNKTREVQRQIDRFSDASRRKQSLHSNWPYVGPPRLATALVYPLALVLQSIWTICNFSFLGVDLLNISATLQQLSLRCQQILGGPSDLRLTLHDPTVPLQVRSRRYVRFWNTVWLIMNDLVLGWCARQLLHFAISQLDSRMPILFQVHLIDDIKGALAWLDDWPVGLKLNTPLSRFFRSAFSIMIEFWGGAYRLDPLLGSHAHTGLRLLGLTGCGGLTLTLAVLRDTIALLTLHLQLCHTITLYLVSWQLSSLGGLWNLFRGKKWNVLRQRTDSYAYDVDQLFLGTLLFTVSAFLFPTVLTYAALFGLVKAVLWLSDQSLRVVIEALNAFPLFEVLLRLKEPSRLPDGVIFKLRKTTESSAGHVLEILNAPRSLSSILLRRRRE